MSSLMQNDPTVKPSFTLESELNQVNNMDNNSSGDSSDGESNPTPRKKKPRGKGVMQRRLSEMTDYMKERDHQFLSLMQTVHEDNKSLMEQLINKL